jgi:CRP/FNR family transcriptional regulator, cyclic AMP receptor protein
MNPTPLGHRIGGVTTTTMTQPLDNELFEGLTTAEIATVDGRFPAMAYRKGELIYSPYDPGEALMMLERGHVRLYRSAADGRQLTLAILDEGAAFGLPGALDEQPYDAYAEAFTDCTVRMLPTDQLEALVATHPRVALNLMRSLAGRLREVEDQVERLAFLPVSARLAAKLLELMDRYGRVTPQGIRIDERFTHLQLAEMIGTSRETLTKVINELRDSGVIDVRDRLVWVLDAHGLERFKRAG